MAAVAALAIVGCEEGEGARASATTGIARSAAIAACAADDPHTKHVSLGFACETCHPCGGTFYAGGTLPGGQPVTGTIARGAPTTCTVSCHSPLGVPVQTVAWNGGPLTCVSCHAQTLVAGARSAHPTGADRSACLVCHDATAHMSGAVRLTTGHAGRGDAACLSCHSGEGRPVAGKAPPVVVEFGPGGSDAHGAGGAEPARPCLDCHDPHASTSVFLLGHRTDPAPLPAHAVASRAGIGAEALCGRCHVSRHQSCNAYCHGVRRVQHASDPAPSGAACFACHGHEGIVRGDDRMVGDDEVTEFYGFFDPYGCKHCHGPGPNLPPLESTPPSVTGLIVANDGVATATVTWTSAEAATSYVEYGDAGTTDVVRLVGDPRFQNVHSVQVPGLAPDRPQEVRIRTADRLRNVGLTAREVLTIGAPSTPAPNRYPDAGGCTATVAVQLSWAASTDPNGDALVYELQVSGSSRFETLLSTGTSAATTQTLSLAAARGGRRYYWRVRGHEAAPEGLASTWSWTETFALYSHACE